jgi:hypothetical protein
MSLDGVELDAPDSPANAERFGRKGKDGTSPFPKVRLMALAECGTHAVTAIETAEAGGGGEAPLAVALARAPGNLEAGMLVMADRGIYSWDLCQAVTAAGADFCLRVPTRLHLPALQWLPDGSYLSHLTEPGARGTGAARARLARGADVTTVPGVRVRVVDYDVPGRGGGEVFTLITSVLDHQDMTAADLAAAYHERWEIELAFDEIKTHQRGPAAILRSRSPDLVLQELYGLLITHYAIRRLMTEAADQAELDPDRLSFTRALRIIRRHVTDQAAFSPLPPGPRDS